MSAPPSSGATQVTTTPPVLLGTAVGLFGTEGNLRRIAMSEFAEYGPTPASFFAATIKVYDVRSASPLIVALSVFDVESAAIAHVVPTHDFTM